ncbi:protein of unknown function [Cupriavidus taiwanensis]|nr:protein of unknown function [Cupriavidus taiwanensis]
MHDTAIGGSLAGAAEHTLSKG